MQELNEDTGRGEADLLTVCEELKELEVIGLGSGRSG
jgi:hypothetical protein